MSVLVVIPMFGKGDYTKNCITGVIKNSGMLVDILIVDDGSPEPFVAVEEYLDMNVTVLRLKDNVGFTGASNAGILWAQKKNYNYVHLLNNDTEPHKDFIKKLYDVMEADKNVAIASSVRLYPKDNSYLVELYGVDLIRGFQQVIELPLLKDEVIECNWVPLCSSLIRMDVIREIGILDKQMRTHSSDLDYCLRVKMAHHKIVISTESRVIHFHEVTTKEHGITPERDQRVLLEKLAGLGYAQFMKELPLDAESKTYGKLDFTVYKK